MEELLKTINALSNDDFEVLLTYLDKQKKKRARDILIEAQRHAKRFSKSVGLSTGSQRAGKLEPKYANPGNPDQTWSGMGRKPEWFRRHIENSGDASDMLIR